MALSNMTQAARDLSEQTAAQIRQIVTSKQKLDNGIREPVISYGYEYREHAEIAGKLAEFAHTTLYPLLDFGILSKRAASISIECYTKAAEYELTQYSLDLVRPTVIDPDHLSRAAECVNGAFRVIGVTDFVVREAAEASLLENLFRVAKKVNSKALAERRRHLAAQARRTFDGGD